MNEPNKNPLLENTLFINLANRQDRCSHIQQELSKIGIKNPTRFNAIKTNMGQVGCSMSHLKCLEMAKHAKWEYVFICEDDAVFTNPTLLLNRLNQVQTNPVWDVLIVGGNNQRPFFPTTFDGFIQVHNCQTTTAYIVKRTYYDILIQNIKESLERLLREPQLKHLFSIDIYWKKLQIKDTWLMAVPATVSQLEGISDIEGRSVSYNQMMLDYEKKWMELPTPPPNPHIMNQMSFSSPSIPVNNPVVKEPPIVDVKKPLLSPSIGLSGNGWNKGFLNSGKKIGMNKIIYK